MENEKEEVTIHQALKAVSDEMPIIGRNKTADVGKFSYSYADLEKIWEIAKPIVEKHGFLIFHRGDGQDVVTTAYHLPTKNAIDSSIKLTTVDPQKKGGEITYYRRYNLCMLFNIIVANEDKDAQGTELVDEKYLQGIKEQVELMTTVEELQNYFLQIKPTDKKVIAIFSARKNEIQ